MRRTASPPRWESAARKPACDRPGDAVGNDVRRSACDARGDAARKPARKPARGERGIALLLALLTMVLLAVAVTEFTVSTQVGYRRAAMWLAARRAALVADGGLVLAQEVLRFDASLGIVDSLGEVWAREMPPINTGAGMLAVRIEDEQSRLNLNALGAGALSPAGRRFQALLDRLQLDRGLAGAVADWVDRNQEPGAGPLAAEADWYARLDRPYRPRNAPLADFAELALVRGFTPAVLARLRPFVTVLPDANSKVNANTAPPEVLRVMDPRLDDQALVARIVQARASSPFSRPASLAALPGMEGFGEGELDRLFTTSSSWFRVRSTGDVQGAMRSLEALVHRGGPSSVVVHLLPRRGPNIVGLDTGPAARLDDAGLLGAAGRR